jgi:pilus assembly protein CpaE
MAIVTVVGSKGGCGVSLLATNLGVALAAENGCLLIDLNPMLGSNDLLLDASIEKSWLDLLPVAGELTEHHLDLATASHTSGLRLLGAPPQRGKTLRRTDVVRLLTKLQERFEWILLDLPIDRTDFMSAAFPLTDVLLLVSTLDPQALRSAKRLLKELPQELQQKTGMVFNQIVRGHPAQPKAIADSLGLPLLAVLPLDQRAVGRQVNFGQPCVLDLQSKYGSAVFNLAARLSSVSGRRMKGVAEEEQSLPGEGQEAKEDSA